MKGGPLVFIQDRKTPALCVTLGIIADDQTGAPRQRRDKEVKFITAKLLAYEYELWHLYRIQLLDCSDLPLHCMHISVLNCRYHLHICIEFHVFC